jgi:Domain of unknown function (DUF3560)
LVRRGRGLNTGPLPKKIMGHEFFLWANLNKIRSLNHIYLITNMFNVYSNSYFSVFTMNYIKQLQADKAETLDSARSIEAAINHLISYLSCLKFHVNTRVQVGDVLRDLLPIQGMNDFESERAAKAARFRQLAEKHANIATGRHFAARERLEVIPLGQPILVGDSTRNGQ